MLVDAHFHADDAYEYNPQLAASYEQNRIYGLASVHSAVGLRETRRIMAGTVCRVSFGIHPQHAVMDEADTLAELARSGAVDAIGECGFDFFGDRACCVRDEQNEKRQRAAFEYQLELAERYNMPLVIHIRKANDMIFQYAKRMARLPALVMHAWPGPANDALSFLRACPRTLFSFGRQLGRGNKKVRASLAALPVSALVTESDAPYQAPQGHAFSTQDDLPRIIEDAAALLGIFPQQLEAFVFENFTKVFPL